MPFNSTPAAAQHPLNYSKPALRTPHTANLASAFFGLAPG